MRQTVAVALAGLLIATTASAETISFVPGNGAPATLLAGTGPQAYSPISGGWQLSGVTFFTRVPLSADGSGPGNGVGNAFGLRALQARGWSVSAFDGISGGSLSRVSKGGFFVDARRGSLLLDVRDRPAAPRPAPASTPARSGGNAGGSTGAPAVPAVPAEPAPAPAVPDVAAVPPPFVPEQQVVVDNGGALVSPVGGIAPAQHDPAPVPEPATMLLVGAGVAALARRRMMRRAGR